jgi:PAS domain S-box-containing protein
MDGRILDANDRFLSMMGYTRKDLPAMRWTDMTPPEFIERDEQAIVELRRTGRNDPYSKELLRKDGSPIPVLVSAVVTDARRREGIAFALDLTNQKQLERVEAEREAMLRENERLYHQAQEANRRKDEFITMLSHELRTPLNAVLGWLTMLRQGLHDPAQRERAVAVIERNTRIQEQLLSDLLDISRVARGSIALARTDVEVDALIRAVVETMRATVGEKGIELDTTVDDELGTVRGDPVRLQQVVWNLLSNAVKFTPRGGRIEVRAQQAGATIEISVRDWGAGISPGFLPFVFDRFRQEEAAEPAAGRGVGLGLPIVKHLVTLHGGTVSAASAGKGQGATFTVRLPAAGCRPNSVPKRAGTAAAHLAAGTAPAAGAAAGPGASAYFRTRATPRDDSARNTKTTKPIA